MTTFLRAVKKNREEDMEDIMEMLMDGNQDLNITDKKGTPVLHFAIENENIEIVKMLLFPPGTQSGHDENGQNYDANIPADPNQTDKNGVPPLFKAIEVNSLEAVRLLVRVGADVNYQLAEGSFETALHLSIEQQNANDIAKFLLSIKEIDVNS